MTGQPKLRILHVFRAPLGGLLRHVVDLARAQAQAGHQVGIVCDTTPSSTVGEALLAGLAPELSLGLTRLPMARNPGPGDLMALWRVSALARRVKADILHGHGAKGGLYARAARLFGLRRALAFYTPHGGSLHYLPGTLQHVVFARIERLLERLGDAILFESAYALETYRSRIGEPTCAAPVIHNGVHPFECRPIALADRARDFVFIGELRDLKGWDVLLEALILIKHRGKMPSIVFVGSGPDEAALRIEIARHGLDGDLLPPRPVREALALGRIMVLPSRAESLPYVILEAAAAARPIVATRVGGLPEIFGPQSDQLVAPGDARAMAEALMLALAEPPASLAQRADALAVRICNNFSVASMVEKVLEAYARVDRIHRR